MATKTATKNTDKPVAESGFRPNIATIPNPNGGGGDVAEYTTPERSRIDSGFYVTDRGLPWHVQLSRRLDTPELMTGSDRTLTAAEALDLAGLNYGVELAPLFAKVGKSTFLVPGKMATVRTDTNTPLGVVSPKYRVVQNADAFAFADAIVDDGGAHYETAAALFGGRQVFLSMELPDHMHVDGDPSDYRLFLLVSNGHDGKNALRADVTVERVVCRNTLRIAHKRAISSFTIKHTSSITGRLTEARKALGLSFAYAEAFTETASALVGTSLVDRQVDELLTRIFPLTERQAEKAAESPDDELVALGATAAAKVREVYRTSPTVERGTAYGVLNAVTEYLDHAVVYKGKGTTSDADVKAKNLLNRGPALNAKQRAWDVLSELVPAK